MSLVQLAGERAQVGLRAELGIDARGIDDVVSVFASAPRGENRRQVQMRDAEPLEVRDVRARVVQRERAVELQPIRGGERTARDRRRGRLSAR